MQTINDGFINALLAEAAYIKDLFELDSGDLKDELENRLGPVLTDFLVDTKFFKKGEK